MKTYINFKSRFILFFCTLFFTLRIYGCVFPCYCNLKYIPNSPEILKIHYTLCEKVKNPPKNRNSLKNQFACCFIFRFNDNTSQIIYIEEIFESGAPFYSKGTYPCASSLNTLIFSCPENIPEIIYLKSVYDNKTKAPETETPLVTSLKAEYEKRMGSYQWESPINSSTTASAVRTTDSETQSIYKMNQGRFLNKNLIEKLPKNKTVTRIEFHGCSTRDMCPFCFTHMNMVQLLANNNKNIGFLGLLKTLLKDQNISTSIIISSCISCSYIHNESYNWLGIGLKDKCVNQFRIPNAWLTGSKCESQKGSYVIANIQNIQQSIQSSKHFIQDVSGAGNCGIFAIQKAVNRNDDQQVLRNEIFPINHRMRMNGEWLALEDLSYVASYLSNKYQRGLIIVNTVPSNILVNDIILPDDYIYTYYANNQWYNTNSLEDAICNVNKANKYNTQPVMLLYSPGYWQAILPVQTK